jgi:uncharacterized protein (DUF1015 family)
MGVLPNDQIEDKEKPMATIRPFRALRPVEQKCREVASVPYDVVTTAEAKELAEGNPLSFLHVIRPEIDLAEGTDLYSEEVYQQALKNFHRLESTGVLIEEQDLSIYLYRLEMGDHVQTGVACCCSVDEYDGGVIKKHEHTRKEKEDDRLKHMLTLSAHVGPVLMTYRERGGINRIIERETKNTPMYDFVAEDGIRHTVWKAQAAQRIVEEFAAVPCLYIADGHHRAAGASRVKKAMKEMREKVSGNEDFNYFLAVLFGDRQLKILPYNRWISDLGGFRSEAFLEKVGEHFEIKASDNGVPEGKGRICMYISGRWYSLGLRADEEVSLDPVSTLDLNLFQSKLLEPVLGVTDQRNDKRIDFIGGERSVEKLKRLVDEKGGVAFSFNPVRIDQLLAVSDAGEVMPPKSTWFVPKLRSGILIHQF